MQIKNKTFCLITLGCRTNICESDVISNQLLEESAVEVDKVNDANICIVNTCCVTNRAENKSKYYINQAIRANKCKLIIVIGCMPQIGITSLQHHKIGIILGNKKKTKLIEYIKSYKFHQPIIQKDRFKKNDIFQNYDLLMRTHTTRAFIKIQDGCDFMCSYCIIPFVRGRQRSLPHNKIIQIIQTLVKNEYKEIVLTGVNTAGYRENLNYGFIELLKDINGLSGNFRVRISSLEPFQLNKDIVDLITSNDKRWCQHFHICLQSGSDNTIQQMKRKYTIKDFFALCNYIRERNKMASITTDCIVGFPTETKDDFKISCKNIKKIQFADIHIFPFSSRPFTQASKLPISINDCEKKRRFIAMDKIKKTFKCKYLKKFIGKTLSVLFEKSKDPKIQIGHSEYFFTVKVKTNKSLVNEFVLVKIIKLENNQLFGELL
ncbi:MAG: tRNA (N(6)-L-threonylcarbamoyladenosine(37)-C(2))-methylthiotransferase MtaB [Mycoplasmataceae bacterium]|nr:tRNA (N(6)-L-threonylcarbamoyladenosine(37)-C(2))-methylthiotransferase MtaB [Mycoplasmataceae bacterium]